MPPGGSPAGLGGGRGAGANGAHGSITGYRRSDYAPPTAYPGSYGSSGYSPLGDAPTTVAGPAGATNAAAARTALGAATRSGSRPSPASARPARRARLLVRHIDPWSTLKFSFVLAVAMFFVWLVAIGVLYGVLDGMGVWDRLNGTYADLVSGEAPTGSPLISAGRVFGLAAVIGAINSLLFAVAVTIGAFVYNVSADLVGGVEVTLSERD
jgi:hypothetical protein